MKPSVDECKVAMQNDEIDDNTLVRMFRACLEPIGLVASAIECNNERAVRLLIAEQFDFSNVDECECGFLHLAYEFASLRIVDMLLAAGLKSTNDDRNAPPWHYAACNSDENVMAHLIASGIDVNAADSDGFTLAHRTARRNKNENVLAMLIAAGADLTTRDVDGDTICHFAAANSNAAVMAMLIPLCDVNAVNNYGDTPCISAAFQGNPFALELLIAAGANANALNNNGHSAFDFAVDNHDDRVLELLVDASVDTDLVRPFEGMTSMHVAALRGNHRLLGKLIAAGGDVNARLPEQATPCHVICHERDLYGVLSDDEAAERAFQSLSLLLAAKADVHAKDARGSTPLHSAVGNGFYRSVSLLLSYGADVDARREKDGLTPLFLARDARIVALLIAANADVNAIDNTGLTACHQACANPPVLAQLLDAGANPLVRSRRGATPLHHAAREKDAIDAILLLIRANADVNECDNAGNSAGHWAANNGRVENLKLLIAHGAQINQRNNVGLTMLTLAALADASAFESMRLLIDSGADTSVINGTVAFRANASVFRLLRSFGVNLNAVDVNGNTLCHAASDNSHKLVALFALGTTMTVVNNDGKTPYEMLCAEDEGSLDEAVVTCVAAGLGFGVQTQLDRTEIAAVVIAGGGHVSAFAYTDVVDLVREERTALHRIEQRQTELFRARAFHVCVGFQSLRLSALEMCEILAHMFAPLESIVPFHIVWKVVTTVKHFDDGKCEAN